MKLSFATAHRLAVLSRDAYLSNEEFANRYTNFDYFDQDGTQAYLVETWSGELVVVFRGTEVTSLTDIKADLKFRKIYEHGATPGLVHRGFQAALDAVYEPLLERLIERRKDHRIFVTGHSLGASLATLFYGRVAPGDPVKPTLVTFGSPRVGDRSYREAFKYQGLDENCIRVRNHNDIITREPPAYLFYKHVGRTMWYIDHAGIITVNPPWHKRLSEYATGMIRGFSRNEGIDSLNDHFIEHYCSILGSLAR